MISLIPNYTNILKILNMSKNNPNIQLLNTQQLNESGFWYKLPFIEIIQKYFS